MGATHVTVAIRNQSREREEMATEKALSLATTLCGWG